MEFQRSRQQPALAAARRSPVAGRPDLRRLDAPGARVQDVGNPAAPQVGVQTRGRGQRAHPGQTGRAELGRPAAAGRTGVYLTRGSGGNRCCLYAPAVRRRIFLTHILFGTSKAKPSAPGAARSGGWRPRLEFAWLGRKRPMASPTFCLVLLRSLITAPSPEPS